MVLIDMAGKIRLGIVRENERIVRFANGEKMLLDGPPLCRQGSEALIAWQPEKGRDGAKPLVDAPVGAHDIGMTMIVGEKAFLFSLCEGLDMKTAEDIEDDQDAAAQWGYPMVKHKGQTGMLVCVQRGIVNKAATIDGTAKDDLLFVPIRERPFDSASPYGVLRKAEVGETYYAFLVRPDWVEQGAHGFWISETEPAHFDPKLWRQRALDFLEQFTDSNGYPADARKFMDLQELRAAGNWQAVA